MSKVIQLDTESEFLVTCPYCGNQSWMLKADKVEFNEIIAMQCDNPDCWLEYDIVWNKDGLVVNLLTEFTGEST